MPVSYLDRLNRFIEHTIAALPEALCTQYDGSKGPDITLFVRHFFAHILEADLNRLDPQRAVPRALAAWEFFLTRKGTECITRVFSPDMKTHGWRTPRTVVQTINNDMPFLVDSLLSEIGQQGIEAYSVLHPILWVKRDKAGLLQSIAPFQSKPEALKGYQAESLIDCEVTYAGEGRELEKLRQRVDHVLGVVQACVRDYKPITMKVDEAIEELKAKKEGGDIEEVVDFLNWLRNNHFVFLGYVSYRYGKDGKASVVKDSPLGLFSLDEFPPEGAAFVTASPEVRRKFITSEWLEVSKSSRRSMVHRPVHMDYVGLREFDAKGTLVGERRILGLFTSNVYFDSVQHIPVLRRKVAQVLERSGMAPNGHDGKALMAILEQLPRDEMFEMSVDALFEVGMDVMSLENRPRIRLFARKDVFERFVSCLVYVPRRRFNTEMRFKIQEILEKAWQGKMEDFYTQMTDSPLARIHYKIKTTPGEIPEVDIESLNKLLAEKVSAWEDSLQDAVMEKYGENHGQKTLRIYAEAFPPVYRNLYHVKEALADIDKIEDAVRSGSITLDVRDDAVQGSGSFHLKIYNPKQQIALSDIIPTLENMGCKVLDEIPSYITPLGHKEGVWLRDFHLKTESDKPLKAFKSVFEEALYKVWTQETENDRFNRLALLAELGWRDVALVRAIAKYLKQIRFAYGQDAMEDAFARYPQIARMMVQLFHLRFDPAVKGARETQVEAVLAELDTALTHVVAVTDDRVFRRFREIILAIWRTNFFQKTEQGEHKPYLSFKFDPSKITDLPLPRPYAEIFVYSVRVEGVHLRGNKVARGGLRWSDRHEDFRTEVLGLVKAQMVKNAVIVPEGSKGGFVVKCPPASGDRQEMLDEGIFCYITYLSGLLDITDNIVNGAVVPPLSVVRYDGDDPYLVVAADKGTATFSDIANSVSLQYSFWLGDAFASGGSAGYDHKKMGITAKGGWVSVRRHFQEMGKDIQTEDFTVVGIGDMSGDVFGNGMLLSEHIQLVGAFNHLHVFVDPNPDAAKSFKERERMFNLPRSTWKDYNAELISQGGGVFERSAKSIAITPEMKARFAITADSLSPDELIRALLMAPVELLWNGGIGTYVKAIPETHDAVGDRANNAVRINGSELRCKVVGEGGNLGFTQRGRIEYALNGGRINTDAIDNSGGVDCSDHEVNIKIALGKAVASGALTVKTRDALLAEMTPEVDRLVLKDNILQTQAITIAEVQGIGLLQSQARLMRALEKQGLLNRALEFLPDEEALAERQASGRGLTRPELAVLLAYSKLDLYRDLLHSTLPDDPYFVSDLLRYFPEQMQQRHADLIQSHQLRREIIGTAVTNSIINRMGSTFFFQVAEDTGVEACDIARAYVATRDAFGLRRLWAEIEALPASVPVDTKVAMFVSINALIYRCTLWLLRSLPQPIVIGKAVETFEKPIAELSALLPSVLTGSAKEAFERDKTALAGHGVPEALARDIALLPALSSAHDIITVATSTHAAVKDVAALYFTLDEELKLGWLRQAADRINTTQHWARLAVTAIIGDLYEEQRRLTADVLVEGKGKKAPLDYWRENHENDIRRYQPFVEDLTAVSEPDVPMLVVALRKVQNIARGELAMGGKPKAKAAA